MRKFIVKVFEGQKSSEFEVEAEGQQAAQNLGLELHRKEYGQPQPGDPFTVEAEEVK